ncbi:MAG TPA: diaminobutyrate--2-oxoglutarate transaminase [Polyangiaceae bacterium LLY-WYZ-14_1]|jgi:diaminobutyrate-2-oxoglutarate transaminase|nr:diaminobutyrate--2-oxoglutarate transaminase [Polyangiaceae bacterium LLY-WYZ-14_1]
MTKTAHTPHPTIERLESNVRGYCRSFPTEFTRAKGSEMWDRQGNRYLDFFAGAGALNYGHNPEVLKNRLLEYLAGDNITHALDMTTEAKVQLLETMETHLLKPRGLDYKVLFPGPTGTNSVEASLKLARKVTGRTSVLAFTNGFHGMTLGSLAVTGNQGKRDGAGIPLSHVTRAPFDGYHGDGVDTLEMIERLLSDGSSGVEAPAAFLLETVQAEGGVNVASMEWIRRLADLAKRHGALFIADDIQVGCGRTGRFFSFEEAGVVPDMVNLSKSISGYGLPMALLLVKPELDQFSPGEHNGTFRGHNPAFVTARAALETFWADDRFAADVRKKADAVAGALGRLAERFGAEHRGRGLIQGLAFDDASIPGEVSAAAFERGLIIETAGPDDEVLKLLPALSITQAELDEGIGIIERSLETVVNRKRRSPSQAPKNLVNTIVEAFSS